MAYLVSAPHLPTKVTFVGKGFPSQKGIPKPRCLMHTLNRNKSVLETSALKRGLVALGRHSGYTYRNVIVAFAENCQENQNGASRVGMGWGLAAQLQQTPQNKRVLSH